MADTINGDPERFRRFIEADDGKPVVMINLLRFRDQATYLPGSNEQPCTGAEAYAQGHNDARREHRDSGTEGHGAVVLSKRGARSNVSAASRKLAILCSDMHRVTERVSFG